MKLRQTFMLAATIALLALLVTVQANAQGARQRPFSDWLDAQGSFNNPATCYSLIFGWVAPPYYSTLAIADYTGKMGACVQNHGGPAINTTVKGTVSERDLPDGTAEILVNVQFTNALAYALEFGVGPIFGYRSELLGHPERKPGLANGHLQVKFIIPYPGAPLDDLVFTNITYIRFSATASGPLRATFGVPEGTPGRFVVSQTGLFNIPGQGQGVADAFPAEIVRVFKAGN